jgi:predicted nucleic acid-binding protein
MDKKLRIYLETSVISHLDAPDRPDRMGVTLLLWKIILEGTYEIVIGAPVFAELERCYEPKRSFMLDELEKIQYDRQPVTDEAEQLSAEYIRSAGLPRKSRADAMHIALATLANCDAIVSWNFSHIVNLKAMTVVKVINAKKNLNLISIIHPTILLGG